MEIDFTEYDLREMLSALDSMPANQDKIEVFEWSIGGKNVTISVSN
jgi:hypothetical protein